MQDNSTHNYDPALVDRGWSMLEKQLDEVLPQKTKRRFPWFWLVLLLGFFSLAGAGWYSSVNNSEESGRHQESFQAAEMDQPIVHKENQEKEQTDPIVSDRDKNLSSNVVKSTPVVSTEEEEMTAGNMANNHSLTAATTPVTEVQFASVMNQTTSAEESTMTTAGSNENTGAAAENLGLQTTAIAQDPRREEVTPTETHLAINKIRQSDITPPLDPSALLFLEKELTALSLTSTEPISENIPKWRYFVEGQATVALGQQPGFLGGITGVEHQLKQAWTLGFELGYERSQQVLTYNELSENLGQDRADFAPPVAGSYSSDGFDLNSTYGAVTYDRFKSNIMAHYKLSPRWRIGTGLSVALYRQALFNSAEAGGVLDTAVNSPLDNTLYNLFEEPIAIFEYDEFNNSETDSYLLRPNRWQLAGMLTGQYQINRNWGVNLTYRHDLTAWQNGTEFGTPSSLKFGLRYYIR